ncbi:MAG: hypothetical protein CMK59_01795 [Proteobacteria bacterium]|nr:hypothetical protein [Pseudomonadota bacterium]
MAELNIRLTYNRQTGRHDIFVDYQSDADSLPFEHEDDHRALVERLISSTGMSEEDFGEIVIRRLSVQEKIAVMSGETLPEIDQKTQNNN